ncbi:hypothetical protein [Peptoanaerobacter stomatis]
MDKSNNPGVTSLFLCFLITVAFFFMIFLVDYFSTYTIKETVDLEFKNVVITKMAQYLTDEYSSDYIAQFDNEDKKKLEEYIKDSFVKKLKTEKNINVKVNKLELNNPSSLTIVCNFEGTYEFKPMIGKGKLIFDMPVDAKAKVIRFDEY